MLAVPAAAAAARTAGADADRYMMERQLVAVARTVCCWEGGVLWVELGLQRKHRVTGRIACSAKEDRIARACGVDGGRHAVGFKCVCL